MDENCLAYGIEISDSDWEKTTANVKQLVEKMGQHMEASQFFKNRRVIPFAQRVSLGLTRVPCLLRRSYGTGDSRGRTHWA
ncbi:hypothetical protein SAMD00079811_80640 (plasmid) [Scytonema sp. HK-05]|nr:hypothetical protein NIES2130_28870 [Scytonema sp. HK-05]BAY50435.1 hypothetical protein SAMD00079811_80640 [Scytonema sp. HK-05]